MNKSRFFWIVLLAAASQGAGCGVPQKQFKVTSYPPGATIFIDNEPRGQTDDDKLTVEFYPKAFRTLRLEKDGFQTTGDVLEETSKDHLAYNLQEAPNTKRTLTVLQNIQKSLDQMTGSIDKLSGSLEKIVTEKDK